jgi:hypothetical protein
MKRMSIRSTFREYVLFLASTLLCQSALSRFVGTGFGREEHGSCLAICNEELRLCTICNAIHCTNIYIIILRQLFRAYVWVSTTITVGSNQLTFDNQEGPSLKTSTKRTSIKHHKMASHSYLSPQSSHHQVANTKIQEWLAPLNRLPSNNTTIHIIPHCCPCWATSYMRPVSAIPSPSSPQVL